MKLLRIIWSSVIFIFISYGLNAQVFQGQANLPVPPDAANGVTRGVTISEATVTNVGILGGCRQLDRILMNITHTWVGDVAIFLVSPSGTVLELTSSNGGASDNWINTEFTDTAPLNIVDGAPPYTGTFRPEGRQQSLADNPSNAGTPGTFTLVNTFTGENADGIWQLYVNDFVGGDVGEILNWELEFTSGSELSATLTASEAAVCVGEAVTLTVGGNLPSTTTYLWTTGETNASIIVSPNASTVYGVTVTDGSCSIELTESIDVVPRPTITGPTSTCGEPVTLTSPGNNGAVWSTGESGQSITVNPTSTTSYTVSNGSPGCQSEPFTLEVVPLSVTASASIDQICAGEAVVLTAGGGAATASYTWSTGGNGTVISVSPATTTTYDVTVTDGPCTQTESVTITVEESTVVVSLDQEICAGETIELTATGSGPFSWSTGEVGDRITVSPLTTSTYTVTTGSGNCAASDEVTITVNPEVNVTASADQASVCAGVPVVLTAVGDGPFVWSTGASGPQITVTPDVTTTYFVDVSNGFCTDFAEVSVTVLDPPTLELGGDRTLCASEASTLTATGNFTSISWNTGQTGSTIDLPAEEGLQTLIATATNGSCSITEEVTITINRQPSVTTGPDTTICAGETVTLTASGDGPFLWSDGTTNQTEAPSITVTPDESTTYFVDVFNGPCTDFAEVNVTVLDPPTLELGGDRTLCASEASTLTATGNFISISWNTGQTGATIDLPAEEGPQTLIATASNGNCSITQEVEITIVAEPLVFAGEDLTICAGDSIQLEATGNGPFSWSAGLNGSTPTVRPLQNTPYVVLAGGAECQVADTVTVFVQSLPEVDLGPDREACVGEELSLTSLPSTGSFSWSDGSNTEALQILADSTVSYSLTVTEAGCSATDSIRVQVRQPVIELGPDRSLCPGDSVFLSGPEATTYSWSNGATGSSVSLAPTTSEVIRLDAVIDGCFVSDSILLSVTENQEVSFADDLAICPGDSIRLTPNGIGPFQWSTGELDTEITVSPTESTVFVASVGAGNCAAKDSILVSVRTAASVDLGNNRTVCAGETIRLIPEGNASSFTWSTGSEAPEIDLSPTSTQTISLLATNDQGCTATDSVVLNLVTPQLSFGATTNICPGDNFVLRASGLDVYSWADGGTADSLLVSPQQSTTYLLSGSLLGCSVTDSVRLNVRPRAEVTTEEDQAICPGASVALTATGDGPFRWSNGSPTDQIIVQPTATETYFVIAGEGNCSDTAFTTVTVLPITTLNLGPDQSVCQGDTATLRLSTNGTFNYLDGDFGTTRQVAPSATTVYRASAMLNGCVANDSVTVTVNALPVIEILSTDCSPNNETYDVAISITGGAPPYLVNNNPVGDNFSLEGIPSGSSFVAEVTDTNGCNDLKEDMIDCGCTEIVLGAAARGCNESTESRDLNELLPPGAPAGTWTVINPDENGLPQISGGNSLSFQNATAGAYVLQFEPTGASIECLPAYQTMVSVSAPLAAGRQPFIEERCTESAGPIDLFAELEGATPGGEWLSLSPNLQDNEEANLSAGIFTADNQVPGDYIFRYRAPANAECPGGTVDVVIRLVAIEVAGLTTSPNCEDPCAGGIVVTNANPLWRYGLNGDIPTATTSFGGLCGGDYELLAEDERGCRASQALTVPTVRPISTEISGASSLRLGDSAVLRLTIDAPVDSIIWNQSVNCLTADCREIFVRPLETTEYIARVVSTAGCNATAVQQVIVDKRSGVYVPNAFSPNGDGTNDLLTVYAGSAIEQVTDFRLFDRWGGQLANFSEVPLGDDSFGWNGQTASGAILPPGVYVYQLSFTRIDGSVSMKTGEVVLMR